MTEIPIIALSPEFYKLILNKKKTTTIRSGHRDYPLGDAILNWGEGSSRITISKIEYNKFKINGDFTDYIQKPYENSFDNICIFIENTNYMLSMSDYFLPIYNLY
jgi:hypothetical protein